MESEYPLTVEWSGEDEQYVATCPAFPGLSALGGTRAKALAEAETVLRLFIQSYKDRQIELPAPRTISAYSGQTRLRLSKSLHRLAATMAESEEVSLNQYIVDALVMRIGGEQVAAKALGKVQKHLDETRAAAASVMAPRDSLTRITKNTEEHISIEQSYTSPFPIRRKDN